MGWLTARNTADDGVTAPNTISDKDWKRLQDKAAKDMPAFGTREHSDRAIRGRDNYRNRKNN